MENKLNQTALDIEFLLISVIQGVAIAALAGSSAGPIGTLDWNVLPYIISGFLVILIFWAQAINHSLSFVRWPLDIGHSFLYFLSSFVEVMAFSHISDPKLWFIFQSLFFAVVGWLYLYDLGLIKAAKSIFEKSADGQTFYQHMLSNHLFEVRVLVPASLIYNALAAFLITNYPTTFISQHWHIALIIIQWPFGLWFLFKAKHNFTKRSELLTKINL